MSVGIAINHPIQPVYFSKSQLCSNTFIKLFWASRRNLWIGSDLKFQESRILRFDILINNSNTGLYYKKKTEEVTLFLEAKSSGRVLRGWGGITAILFYIVDVVSPHPVVRIRSGFRQDPDPSSENRRDPNPSWKMFYPICSTIITVYCIFLSINYLPENCCYDNV
jgi:hypothetical protein